MLHREAVEPATLALLKSLMAFEPLKQFNLVGGTALALQLGHRKSIDIDLFGPDKFDSLELTEKLSVAYKCKTIQLFSNTILCSLNNVKTDILYYKYPLLGGIILEEGIRMLSLQDIAPMKLAALSQRGAKKDFFDIYFLLHQFSLGEILELYKQKFGLDEVVHVIRSLNYFADAEASDDPEVLDKVSWKEVKLFISKNVNEFLKKP